MSQLTYTYKVIHICFIVYRGGVYLSQSVIALVKIKLNNKIIFNDKKLYNVNL